MTEKEFIRKVAKIKRVYWGPFFLLLLIIEVGILIISFYFKSTDVISQEPLLEVEAIVTLLATSSGIFLPLMMDRNFEREDDRRSFVFSLGLIWTELRKNLLILNQVEVNYKFSILFTLPKFKDRLKMINGKYRFVNSATRELSDKAFLACQNSGSITTFDNDNLLNSVTQAYENIINFRLASLMVEENLRMKLYLIDNAPEKLETKDETMFEKDLKDSLLSAYKELLFSKKNVTKALKEIDVKFKAFGIVGIWERRELDDVHLP